MSRKCSLPSLNPESFINLQHRRSSWCPLEEVHENAENDHREMVSGVTTKHFNHCSSCCRRIAAFLRLERTKDNSEKEICVKEGKFSKASSNPATLRHRFERLRGSFVRAMSMVAIGVTNSSTVVAFPGPVPGTAYSEEDPHYQSPFQRCSDKASVRKEDS